MGNIYRVQFRISVTGGLFTIYVNNIAAVKNGFALNKDAQMATTDDEVKYYVLPHMVNFIEVVDKVG